MRLLFATIGLILLSACATAPATPPAEDMNAEMRKFVEPVNGAPYPQSDVRYYYGNVSSSTSRAR